MAKSRCNAKDSFIIDSDDDPEGAGEDIDLEDDDFSENEENSGPGGSEV